MSDYLDKIQTQKKDGTPLATVPFRDSEAREDITTIQNELTTDTTTIEGNPLNFTTLSAQTAKSTILSVEPIQDLHGFDKPWVGGAGKNKLDDDDFEVGTAWNGDINPDRARIIIPCKASTTYTLSMNGVNNLDFISYGYYETTPALAGAVAFPQKFTTENNSKYIVFGFNKTSITQGDLVALKLQLEEGSTATSYEPYENICPISGRSEIGILGCGKNRLKVSATSKTEGNITFSINDDGTFYMNGTSSPNAYAWLHVCDNATFNTLGLISGESYILSGNPDGSKGTLYIETTSDQHLYEDTGNGIQFTYNGESNLRVTYLVKLSTTVNNLLVKPMIRLATNIDDTFEPYTKSNDLTISLGQTVYGGTLDVENGVLVVDRGISGVNNTWIYSTYGGKNYITKEFNDIYVDQQQSSYFPISSMCEFDRYGGAAYFVDGKMYQNNKDLYIQDSNYTTKESFISAYSDCQIVYYLATPITINLTPHTINLLKGVNNISTDGDKITLTYRDGSVATLGDLTSAVDNLDSKIDESKILTDTATGDKYILVVTNGVLSVEQISN